VLTLALQRPKLPVLLLPINLPSIVLLFHFHYRRKDKPKAPPTSIEQRFAWTTPTLATLTLKPANLAYHSKAFPDFVTSGDRSCAPVDQ